MEKTTPSLSKRELNEQLAPGMEGVEGLDSNATSEEIANNNATRVVKLVYDEYDVSHT